VGLRRKERREDGLAFGKLSPELMSRYVFGKTGARSKRVIVEPSLGLDFGVVDLGEEEEKQQKKKTSGISRRKAPSKYLIVSSDPITGVSERAGWYAVNVSANDVATSGNKPEFMQSIVLFPDHSSEEEVRLLIADMHETASKLGIAILGGHTELSPGVDRSVVVTTAFALADSFVTTAGAREGDTLMMTKTAGVEGTAIIATDPRFSKGLGRSTVSAASRYFEKLSVVEEAVAAYGTGLVHAMHDCTEGGVLGAVFEMATASGLGIQLEERAIPVSKVTGRICSRLEIDPLKLISSGTLIAAVEKGGEAAVRDAVASVGSTATTIGSFERGEKITLRKSLRGGEEKGGQEDEEIDHPPVDEIWRLHETFYRRKP
jgi:hydrogenase expression/formation protein HypE